MSGSSFAYSFFFSSFKSSIFSKQITALKSSQTYFKFSKNSILLVNTIISQTHYRKQQFQYEHVS